MRKAIGPLLALMCAACAAREAPQVAQAVPDEPAVTLQVVKWPELEKAIASHKGQVVVLDVWAEW
jgi:thiol:disulfide interchange protein